MKIKITDIVEKKEPKKGLLQKFFKKFGFLVFIFFVFISQVVLFSAFEAHVINVTARICIPLETRTPGYWKTHPEVTELLLPQTLGCETITTFEQAFDILDSNAQDMRDKLGSHLLAMKFNIAHYGVGGYVADTCGAGGKTFDQLVAEADTLLCNPEAKREDLEAIKNILDCSNNLGKTRICLGFIPVIPSSFSSISNEVLLMTSDGEVIEAEAPAEGEAPIQITPPSEENPETPIEEPIIEETPPVEETPPAEETPPVEETSPAEETPPAEENPPAEETPPAEENPPAQETPPVL